MRGGLDKGGDWTKGFTVFTINQKSINGNLEADNILNNEGLNESGVSTVLRIKLHHSDEDENSK